ncbi:MAG: peptidylprolyl isomerase, partial [Ignavibacteriae bacterium]|nr:peptidylprolyl isomerase [Ignavibacteriota bacterium]
REVFEDPGLANNGGYLGAFGWREMEPALEDVAFTLPVGSISDPVKLNIGYAIIKVESRVHQPLVSEFDYAKVRQKLADQVQEKKILRITARDAEQTSKSLSPSFDEAAVNGVFKNWNAFKETKLVDLESGNLLPDNVSSMKLMEFSRGAWTVKDFVQKVEWTAERQKARVKSPQDVKDMAIGLATREIFLERAKKMGLENDSTVKAHVGALRERYLLKRWGDSILDTVGNSGWSETQLDSMYNENKSQYAIPPEVNVAEILVRTEAEAKALLAQIKRGANFAALAKKNSIRLWAAKSGGELGFGTEATFGPLGKKFTRASVGQIIGPERVDPYWGVFTILEKREGRQKTREEARDDVIAGLLPMRKQVASRAAIDALRNQYAITINNSVLEEIVIQSNNQAMR